MKACIFSDVHCEFHRDGGRTFVRDILPDAELAVVAGDLDVAEGLRRSLGLLAAKYPHVVYVAGNHDYYHSSQAAVEEIRRTLNLPNVHWLEDEVKVICGVRFVGCTMWFGEHPIENRALLSDFQVIDGIREWVIEKNLRSLEFLRQNVTPESIVVTHHLPTSRSTAPRFRDSHLNCFFVCPAAEEILVQKAPRMWVHGHTHEELDYQFGPTRVFCNPFGYVGVEMNMAFKTDEAVLEL